jgi:PIN domain nuclease of toxin-antitoxin system
MTRLLLDTCTFLWWQADDSKLTAAPRLVIGDAADVFVSAATAWEIAIKVGLGKLRVPDAVSAVLPVFGFTELPITIAHTERAAALPLHHKDPFDRMIIAQAQHEDLLIVTHDRAFGAYGVTVLWV